MRRALLLAVLLVLTGGAQAAPVLMISVDGLRPADVLDTARGFEAPVLRGLVASGSYASGVRNALPTVTYPNHTTLITGVWPEKHGIPGNQTFDPLQQNMGGWYWYAQDIKVPTLWDAVHGAGGKVASLSWPVSVGAATIDYNEPEYWRALTPDDIKLVAALSTPGLEAELEKASGVPLAGSAGDSVQSDLGKLRHAGAVIDLHKPMLTTVHLRGLDHIEHQFGPGAPEAKAALKTLDQGIGELIAQARKAQPDLVVAVVSDHGFAPVNHDVDLIAPFVQAGLITLKDGKVVDWQAEPWGGASVAVVLKNPNDAAVKAKVGALLQQLAQKPELGIVGIADAQDVARMGGTPMASFWIDLKPGYEMSQNPAAPAVGPSLGKGTHGYVPTHPEMRASFFLSGPGIAHKALGAIDMRDIAPTLAKVMDVPLPSADGKPLL